MKIDRALERAMRAAGMSDVAVAAELKVSEGAVRRWRRGERTPRAEQLLRLLVVVPGFRELVEPNRVVA